MKKIIFATGNEHKMAEIRMILEDLGMEILSQREAGIEADIVEDGTTFEENALIKAKGIADAARQMKGYEDAVILADDSGLEIDFLNKEPGIYSARYMGEDTSYDIKNQALLDRLDGVEDEKRTARFVCAIAAVFPNGSSEVVRGTMEGIIGHEIIGANGFGYDPIFFLPEYGCTSAQLAPEKKNELSHRGEGLRKMRVILEDKMQR
ncbi:MAG: RdgB/HAM1 family non-canonical purine NTP pyrophosphatase [Dorea sp.]|nr:RdgB/HAM1 family non-canonical purine NTP pyrophosphatase [Dorea sp.]